MWPNAYQPILIAGSSGIELAPPVIIAASVAASAVTPLPGNLNGDAANPDICIENTSNGWAYCNFGDANVAPASLVNGVGVPPASFRIVRVALTTSYVSVILGAGATAGAVRLFRGAGIT